MHQLPSGTSDGGFLEVLALARERDWMWDAASRAYAAKGIPVDDTCRFAAGGGHLAVLRWAREHECEWDLRTCRAAAEGGHLEVLRWAWENGCPWDEETCGNAAAGGHVAVLRWAREHGCPWNDLTCSYAAKNGHLEVLQWAREHGCEWDPYTCHRAAMGGHLEVLRWAREQGCEWDENTCHLAAKGGHLHVLRWAREQGCPWDAETCTAAAEFGHLQVLQWACQHGCPRDDNTCRAAAQSGHSGMLQWARENDPWQDAITRVDLVDGVVPTAGDDAEVLRAIRVTANGALDDSFFEGGGGELTPATAPLQWRGVSIDATGGRVQELALEEGRDELTSLPAGIGRLTALHQLNLIACANLATLPPELSGCLTLQLLDLRGCTALTLSGIAGALQGLPRQCAVMLHGCTGIAAAAGAPSLSAEQAAILRALRAEAYTRSL